MKLHEFFYFNKSDRQVLLVCLLLAMALAGGFYWTGKQSNTTVLTSEDSVAFTKNAHFIDGRDNREPYAGSRQGTSTTYMAAPEGSSGYYDTEVQKAELFTFDPNTADSTQLLRLGLRPWQVRYIYKYRARGGIYRSPSDFARLYGLTQKQFRELEPYIKISNDYRPAAELYPASSTASQAPSAVSQYRDTLKFPLKIKEGEYISLNQLDTTQFKKVPGIGSYYARRIAEYGRRLGGYVSVDQLKEINGFPEEALRFFRITSTRTQKINLNRLTLNQLKSHPYLNYYQARAIVDYRRLHEPLKSLDPLRLMPEFPPEALQRLSPYVEF